jgi:hypothetical protein
MKISKTILAVLATGALGCALFSQQAQASQINGDILLIGRVTLDGTLNTATTVTQWFAAITNDVGKTTVAATTGDFTSIPLGSEATMAAPWVFVPSTPINGFWSVGGFSFDLLSVTSVTRPPGFLNIVATGTIHGAGFDDTPGTFRFTVTGTGVRFGFAAHTTGTGVPDGGSTVMLLGLGISALGIARRFLKS